MGAGHDHHHDHAEAAAQDAVRLRLALGLILGFMVLEVVVAVLSHSLALLADAGHMLTDAAALAAALWAIRLSARPATASYSYGMKRAEILAAAVNGVTLVAAAAVVIDEAVIRLLHPSPVSAVPVLVVALVGVAVNVAATLVLRGGDRGSLNLEGAFQHILTDAAGFIATAVAAVVILSTGFRRADPIASLLVVALMVHAAWALLRASGRILLEGTPAGIDLDEVRSRLLGADHHVLGVHDLHAWVLTSRSPAMSAHVVIDDSCFADGHAGAILDALQEAMAGEFDMEHSTLQLEMAGHSDHEAPSH
jgi:cobalt-zinc-cadmium efflux system protein